MSIIDVKTDKINEYKTEFDNEINHFNYTSLNTLNNSYLSTCSDSTVQSMYSKLNNLYNKVGNSYSSINSYWSNYLSDFNSLENSLKNDDNECTNSSVSSYLSGFVNGLPTKVNNASSFDTKENLNYIITPETSSADNMSTLELYTDENGNVEDNSELVSLEVDTPTTEIGENQETINCFYDDASVEELQQQLDLLDLTRSNTEKEIEFLEAEYDKAEEKVSHDETPVISLENYPEVTDINQLNELIEAKKADLTLINYYKKEIKNKIELKPYDDIYNSQEYKDFIESYNVYVEDLDINAKLDHVTAGGETIYVDANTGEEIDPLLLAKYEYQNASEDDSVDDVIDKCPDIYIQSGMDTINVMQYYPFMTEDEVNVYHYLYKVKGKEEANAYLLKIEDAMNQRIGLNDAEEWIEEFEEWYELEKNGDDFGEILLGRLASLFKVDVKGFFDGVDTWREGIENAANTDGRISASDYEKMAILNYLQNNTDAIDHLDFHYKTSSAVGNMFPSIIASAATNALLPGAQIMVLGKARSVSKAVGLTAMGTSVYGNSKNQALLNGHSVLASSFYGLMSALSETTLEYYLGKLPGLSETEGLSLKNVFLEGLEEFTQEYVDAGMRAVILGEDINLDEVSLDGIESFFIGALTSAYLNGGKATLQVTIKGTTKKIDVAKAIKYKEEHPDANYEEVIENSYAYEGSVSNSDANNTQINLLNFGLNLLRNNNSPKNVITSTGDMLNAIINENGVNAGPLTNEAKAANSVSNVELGEAAQTLVKKGYSNEEIIYLAKGVTGADFVKFSKDVPSKNEFLQNKINEFSKYGYSEADMKKVYEMYNQNSFAFGQYYINLIEQAKTSKSSATPVNTDKKTVSVFDSQYYGTETVNGITYYKYRTSDGKTICIQEGYDKEKGKQILNNIQRFSEMNPELYKYWKKIYISSESCPENEYYAKFYNKPGYTIPAQMNPHVNSPNFGTMYFWKEINPNSIIPIMAHESSHCLDAEHSISYSQEWSDAVKADGNFTSNYAKEVYETKPYGETGKYAEDYADFFKMYYKNGAEYVKKHYPNRVDFFRRNMPELYNEMF